VRLSVVDPEKKESLVGHPLSIRFSKPSANRTRLFDEVGMVDIDDADYLVLKTRPRHWTTFSRFATKAGGDAPEGGEERSRAATAGGFAREGVARAKVALKSRLPGRREPGAQRPIVVRGLDLTTAPCTTRYGDLPDLFEDRPPGSKSYHLRDDVVRAPIPRGTDSAPLSQLPLGEVFYIPAKNIFYVQYDGLGASTLHYYGPFEGDPFELLNLPRPKTAAGGARGQPLRITIDAQDRITLNNLPVTMTELKDWLAKLAGQPDRSRDVEILCDKSAQARQLTDIMALCREEKFQVTNARVIEDQQPSARGKALRIAIDDKGKVTLNGLPVTMIELKDWFDNLTRQPDRSRDVRILCDKSVQSQQLADVIRLCSEAGFEAVSVAVRSPMEFEADGRALKSPAAPATGKPDAAEPVGPDASAAPRLQFRLVAEAETAAARFDEMDDPTASDADAPKLRVLKEVLLDESDVAGARVFHTSEGTPQINLQFDEDAKKRFADITAGNINRRLAIVWDGKVLCAPMIRTTIPEGRATITGNFTAEEAKSIVDSIQAAAAVPEAEGNTRRHESVVTK
jgi:biopolymer transport protein ExbD